jgi:hypothetical protein
MKKATEYQEHAAECRMLAAAAKPEHREMLLKMAETWESLAQGREEHVERRKRVSLLATPPARKPPRES